MNEKPRLVWWLSFITHILFYICIYTLLFASYCSVIFTHHFYKQNDMLGVYVFSLFFSLPSASFLCFESCIGTMRCYPP